MPSPEQLQRINRVLHTLGRLSGVRYPAGIRHVTLDEGAGLLGNLYNNPEEKPPMPYRQKFQLGDTIWLPSGNDYWLSFLAQEGERLHPSQFFALRVRNDLLVLKSEINYRQNMARLGVVTRELPPDGAVMKKIDWKYGELPERRRKPYRPYRR